MARLKIQQAAMRPRFFGRLASVMVISACGLPSVQAQVAQGAKAPAPQTYSYTADSGFALMGANIIKVVRDGSRETVEQTMPPMPGRDKEYQSVRVYDFQAHKIYLKILSDPAMPCGVQDISDAAAPPELDPVGGSAALLKELMGDGQMKMTGTATINGISAKVMEVTSPTGNGTVWLAQNGGFVVKLAAVGPDGKPQTLIEVKQLSFAKPPASAFAIPTGCESVETPVKPSTNVTALTLQPIANYTGPCPAHIKMVGTITTDGPGTVFYQFGAGSMEPGETIVFAAAATKTVTHTMALQPKYGNDMRAGAILEAIGADASGKHGVLTQGSNNSSFNITCTSGGGK
jgi:hypothetical protein